jgi:hypothetical protein
MIRTGRAAVILALVLASCGRTDLLDARDATPVDAHPRQPYFSPGDESYAYYEGTSADNRCTRDPDCSISGCAGSTCAAEAVQITDQTFCQGRLASAWPEPQLASCGCLAGECRWYFENDYDRHCDVDADCHGLGPPPGGVHDKAVWRCAAGQCQL